MRIVHVCLSCFYIDGHAYQENELVRQHIEAGHIVNVLTSTEIFGSDFCLSYVKPSSYLGQDGAQVFRLPYRKFLPHAVMKKLRIHPGVYGLLEMLKPEVIYFHGLCGWEIFTVTRYKKKNPGVRLYIDSHEDWNNSARGWLSKNILHKIYYKYIIKKCQPYFNKILCVSLETMDFVERVYGVGRAALEFYPLGGRVYDDAEYEDRRSRGRDAIGATAINIVLLQTGKMGRRKKILESLRAFSETPGDHLIFILAGVLADEIISDAEKLIEMDSRIIFLGWKSTEELGDLLCAADVYVQPGTQSATMQMSLCARCPVIVDDVPSHEPYVHGNGWLVKDEVELKEAFEDISRSSEKLQFMSIKSLGIAYDLLDYKNLAARIM